MSSLQLSSQHLSWPSGDMLFSNTEQKRELEHKSPLFLIISVNVAQILTQIKSEPGKLFGPIANLRTVFFVVNLFCDSFNNILNILFLFFFNLESLNTNICYFFITRILNLTLTLTQIKSKLIRKTFLPQCRSTNNLVWCNKSVLVLI